MKTIFKTFFLFLFSFSSYGQTDLTKIPFWDTTAKMYFLYDTKSDKIESDAYDIVSYHNDSVNALIIFEAETSCLIVDKKGDVLFKKPGKLVKTFTNDIHGFCLLLKQHSSYAVYSLKEQEYILEQEEADFVNIVEGKYVCFVNNILKWVRILNISSGKEFRLTTRNTIANVSRNYIKSENLFLLTDSSNNKFLANIENKELISCGKAFNVIQIDSDRVAIQNPGQKLKMISLETKEIVRSRYKSVSVFDKKSIIYVFGNGDKYTVVDDSGKKLLSKKKISGIQVGKNVLYIKVDKIWKRFNLNSLSFDKESFQNVKIDGNRTLVQDNDSIYDLNETGNITGKYSGQLFDYSENNIIARLKNEYLVYARKTGLLLFTSAEEIFTANSTDFYFYRTTEGSYGLKNSEGGIITKELYGSMLQWTSTYFFVFSFRYKTYVLLDIDGVLYVGEFNKNY